MASSQALAKRASDARHRMAEIGPRLAARLGVDYPEGARSKDPRIQRVNELEAFAAFMASVEASLDGERIDRAAPAETADAEANAETDADSTAATPDTEAAASTAPDAPGSPTRRRSARKDR